MQAETLIADKAFDAQDRVIDPLIGAGKAVVTPPKVNRKDNQDCDQEQSVLGKSDTRSTRNMQLLFDGTDSWATIP